MMDLFYKIRNLAESDYENTFDIARMMDYIDHKIKLAAQKKDVAELMHITKLLDSWKSSINKWKERYRRLLVKINRVDQDLSYLSLRAKRAVESTERLIKKDFEAQAKAASQAIEPPTRTEISDDLTSTING